MNQGRGYTPPPNLFLLLPENKRIIVGESRRMGVENEAAGLIRGAVLLSLGTLVFIAIFLLSQASQSRSIVDLIILSPAVLMGIGLFLTSRRFICKGRLEDTGILIQGRVVEVRHDIAITANGRKTAVRLRYEFVSPENQPITNEEAQLRDDLAVNDLPEPGTPIIVMYANNTCYRVL